MYLNEYESVYPPASSLEGMIMTLLTGAYEGRKFITFDVLGAFLQAELPSDKLLLLVLRGEFVDIMCDINPDHKKNVRGIKGEKVLNMKVERAIYGCI